MTGIGGDTDPIRARLDEMAAPFAQPKGDWGGAHTGDNECWCRGTHAERLHGFYARAWDAERAFDALRAVLDLKRRWDSQPQDLEQDMYAGGHEDGYDTALNDVLRVIAAALRVSS